MAAAGGGALAFPGELRARSARAACSRRAAAQVLENLKTLKADDPEALKMLFVRRGLSKLFPRAVRVVALSALRTRRARVPRALRALGARVTLFHARGAWRGAATARARAAATHRRTGRQC